MEGKVCVAEVPTDWRFTEEQKRLVLKEACSCFNAKQEDFEWKEDIDERCLLKDGSPYVTLSLYLSKDRMNESFLNNEIAFNHAISYLNGFVWGVSYI